MPARVCIVAASPHAGGTTAAIARYLRLGIERAGERAEILSIAGKRLLGCVHCGACRRPPHRCALEGQDDTALLLETVEDAGLLFWVSPVYFYGLPAQAKALVDRAQSRWERLRRMEAEPGVPETDGGEGSGRPTELVLLAGQERGRLLFEGSRLALRYFFETLGRDTPGRKELRGLDGPRDITPAMAGDLSSWARNRVLTWRAKA